MKQGDLQGAMTLTDEALRHYPSSESEWYWKFTGVKAHILELQGRVNESLALVQLEPPSQFKNSDFAIRWQLTRAIDHAYAEQTKEAKQAIEHAEAASRRNHPELLGEVALRKGTVCFLASDLNCAQPAYREALQAAREHKDPYFEAAALNGLGVCYTRQERYDEAVETYRICAQVAQTSGARYSQEQALGNTAWCYRKLGDYENALVLYKQAEEASRAGGFRGDEIYWLTGISNVYSEQGDLASAEEVLVQGLNLARSGGDQSILTEYLNALALVTLELGRIDEAEQYLSEASRVDPSRIDSIVAQDLALTKAIIQEERKKYASAEHSLQEVLQNPGSDSYQKWQARARIARLYAEKGASARAEREYRRLFETFDQARSSVHAESLRLPFQAPVTSFYDDYINFLVAQGRVEHALRVADTSRARTLAEGLGRVHGGNDPGARNLSPKQVARNTNSTLLFYWVGREHSRVWVITPSKISSMELPPKAEFAHTIEEYRRAILEGRDTVKEQNANGTKLFQVLVGAARTLIPKGSRVVVFPGEGLHALNFETLIVPNPTPHYWIEDVTLSEAGSLTLLAGAAATSLPDTKSLLLIGNPEPAVADFPELPQAPVEMQKVSAHFAPVQRKVLGGRQATASAYLQSDLRRFGYLHFVTHGTASLTQPLESAVILSRDGDSYKLYARDIVAHPLDARLVTISACNGAGTRAYAGEGLVGLSWAFLRAGAHNVIASLWEVSDASSTGQLMDKLYEGLDKGEDPAVALRNAKLFILKSNSTSVFRKPFYWAPFQLYSGS